MRRARGPKSRQRDAPSPHTKDLDDSLSAPEDLDDDTLSNRPTETSDLNEGEGEQGEGEEDGELAAEEEMQDGEEEEGEGKSEGVAEEGPSTERKEAQFDEANVDQAIVERLLAALWQRQDMDWTISSHNKSAFQNLCFKHKLEWKMGTKKDLYMRLRPVVFHRYSPCPMI